MAESFPGGAFVVRGGTLVDANGVPFDAEKKREYEAWLAQAEGAGRDFSSLNADDFLAAVERGDLSREDAVALEEARDKPRKGVLDALSAE